jgi:hypothetical protein
MWADWAMTGFLLRVKTGVRSIFTSSPPTEQTLANSKYVSISQMAAKDTCTLTAPSYVLRVVTNSDIIHDQSETDLRLVADYPSTLTTC